MFLISTFRYDQIRVFRYLYSAERQQRFVSSVVGDNRFGLKVCSTVCYVLLKSDKYSKVSFIRFPRERGKLGISE